MWKTIFLSAICALVAISQKVLADENGSTTATITIKVTVNAPPCTIKPDNIDVDFGSEVPVTDVTAGLVEKPIEYTLDCSNMDMAKSLKMIIKGVGADFDAGVLKTSATDLGVQIKAAGAKYPLNTALNFVNADGKPTLTALLVQKAGARLEPGEFNAGATMMVDYQ